MTNTATTSGNGIHCFDEILVAELAFLMLTLIYPGLSNQNFK